MSCIVVGGLAPPINNFYIVLMEKNSISLTVNFLSNYKYYKQYHPVGLGSPGMPFVSPYFGSYFIFGPTGSCINSFKRFSSLATKVDATFLQSHFEKNFSKEMNMLIGFYNWVLQSGGRVFKAQGKKYEGTRDASELLTLDLIK